MPPVVRSLTRRPARLALLATLAALLAGCGSSASSSSSSASSQSTNPSSTASSTAQAPSTQTPSPLASIDGEATGPVVDGISCDTQEQVLYHIHVHLAIYVNGVQRIVPEGIGIAPPRQEQQSTEGPFVVSGSCFYWLHTHTPDGVIHIESPTTRVYLLGQFFDEWRQPLSATQVGPARGTLTIFIDGQRVSADPRAIKLGPHEEIQLDVGSPVVPFQPFAFPQGL